VTGLGFSITIGRGRVGSDGATVTTRIGFGRGRACSIGHTPGGGAGLGGTATDGGGQTSLGLCCSEGAAETPSAYALPAKMASIVAIGTTHPSTSASRPSAQQNRFREPRIKQCPRTYGPYCALSVTDEKTTESRSN
jgi:hypothetical protein